MSQSFSQNLKRLRTEKNYTQEEAAQFLGVTSQTISRWECGTTLPDVMLLPEIARLYCVTVDDLYRDHIHEYQYRSGHRTTLFCVLLKGRPDVLRNKLSEFLQHRMD